jgi:hypothetical protein
MTLTIELPEEEVQILAAKARACGVSAEEYARQALKRDLEEGAPEPFWKAFTQRMHSLPGEAFEALPTDGASEHDHYLYGSPKKNP